MKTRTLVAATAAALAASLQADAVYLNPDGLGQALIFPYYTVRTAPGGNAFNTYLTVVNSTADAKAVRVRMREGRAGRPVLDFNLYLSPNDVWAGAVVPTPDGARIITTDSSCTDPAFTPNPSGPAFLPLHNSSYLNDGFGDTLDRTREGYVEMIEMAVLTESSARNVTHTSAGVPANCEGMRATIGPSVAAPSAGLSGTLTLINVNSGQDFTLDATALDRLSTRAFFRPPGDPYPDFNALEIDPVSTVLAHGHAYRSTWTRPVDAVSAVLMSRTWMSEYLLDNGTRSLTDLVVSMPTRHYYANAASASAPFTAPLAWRAECGTGSTESDAGETLPFIVFFDREERGAVVDTSPGFMLPPVVEPKLCATAAVTSIRNTASHIPASTASTGVFGSTTRGLGAGGSISIHSNFQNGWIVMTPAGRYSGASQRPLPQMVSLPGSTRTSTVGGAVTTGSHTYNGLPVVGFLVRTFSNGTLSCGAGACQGNYGGAFPFRYLPGVVAP